MSLVSVQRRDLIAVAALVMLAVTMLGIGILTTKTVKEVQLMRDGEATALRWATLFHQRTDDTVAAFRQRRAPEFAQTIVWRSSDVSRIVSFEMYDRHGELFYSTGASDWQPSESARVLLNSPITRRHIALGVPTTRLHGLHAPDGPHQYASVIIPFHGDRQYLGSIVTFVDQAEQADSLTHSFGIIATATVILLLISLGTAGYVLVVKGRERWRAEARVRYLSDHDELTGLPNRQSFNTQLEDALDRRRRTRGKVAVIYTDISRFKEINGALGHTAGDAVLRSVAERIKTNIGDGDFAARLGNNEFAIALTAVANPNEVVTFVDGLRKALASPHCANDEQIVCMFSMGAAISPSDGDHPSTLARHANLALNRAKAEGADSFKFFENSMDIAFQRRREREQDLRAAVELDQFQVTYQPQVSLESNSVCGQEALLRWIHPVHGKISPAYFIPLAEETELIVPISEWVLRRACEDAASWAAPLHVAVNLSPVQFKRGGVADLVAKVLEETGLEPGRLELEITETMLMGDTEVVIAELNRLRDLGVAIAMDDFGTGYSSLSYISSFPFNKIKIDKSFIHAMARDDALNAIVKCIVAMGRSLGVTITAEGVETEEQVAMLRSYGCHQVQGFLFGYPVGAAECARQTATSLEARVVDTGRRAVAPSAA